ncbi:MAG: serine/threonine-protein kinase [Elusimicrobiota bacterium]
MTILLSLLMACAQAQEPASSPQPLLLQEKSKSLVSQMESINGALQELDAVRAAYEKDRNVRRHSAKRDAVRGRLGELMAKYSPAAEEFNQQRLAAERDMVLNLVQNFMRRGADMSQIQANVTGNTDILKFTQEVFDLERKAVQALKDEDSAYGLLEQEQRMKRRWLIVFCCAMGAAVLVALLLLRRLRVPAKAAAPALPAPEASLVLPESSVLAGRFRIGKELAWAALGSAFEAVDISSGKPLLIKMPHEELNKDPRVQARFLNLARATAGLKHPNIAVVHAAFVHSGRLFLAAEQASGPPLSELLAPGKRVPLPAAQRVLRQVAAALHHAHQLRLLHGDLTPGTIFVTRDGLAKVADFALGIELRRTAAKLSWNGVIGSPAYSAPEQETGAALRETDIYSLGIVLYEMVTGKLPFPGPNFLAQKREMRFAPPSRAAAGLPAELDKIMERALQAEPQRRFRSVQEMVQALDGLPGPSTGPLQKSP